MNIYINICTRRVSSRYSFSIVFNQILKQIDNPNVYCDAKNASVVFLFYLFFSLYLELWRISKYKECVRININFKVHFMDIDGGEQEEKMSDLWNKFEPMCWMQIAVITSYLTGWWLFSTLSLHIYSGKIFCPNHLVVPSLRKQFSETMHFYLLANSLFSNKNFQRCNLWGNNTQYYAFFLVSVAFYWMLGVNLLFSS